MMLTFILLSLFTVESRASANPGTRLSSRFSLVNSKGELIEGEAKLGLLLYNGGTVCDDSFNQDAADAVCKELGYTEAVEWTSDHSFNIQSNYEINLDDVECSEAEWDSCSYTDNQRYINCDHAEDVFLSCNPTDTKRRKFALVDSEGSLIEGEAKLGLLLYYGGTVCDDSFNLDASDAVCKELGYTDSVYWKVADQGFQFRYNKEVSLDDVQCSGTTWENCTYTDTERDINCNHSEDVLLSCNPTGVKRPVFGLVDSGGKYMKKESRLEEESGLEEESRFGLLLYNGGTVCDDYFDFTAADAICKYMGYTDAIEWSTAPSFSIQENYPIRLDNVRCSSPDWADCTFSTDNNCGHSEDVFLNCNPTETPTPVFTLVDKEGKKIAGPQLGLLLYRQGTVCDDDFDHRAAGAICKQMGFRDAVRWSSGQEWDIQSNYQVTLDNVECGSEDWGSCTYTDARGDINCAHSEDVFISCNPTDKDTPLFILVDMKNKEVKGGELGLLLYRYGTVCDDGFNDLSADAVCKHMGYVGAVTWNSNEVFDIQSKYDIHLDDVTCTSAVWESCSFSEYDNCAHSEDVFLSCEEREEVPVTTPAVPTKPTSLVSARAEPTTPQPQPPTPDLCVDTGKHCEYWSERGECERNKKFMWKKCRKSCKVCSDDEEEEEKWRTAEQEVAVEYSPTSPNCVLRVRTAGKYKPPPSLNNTLATPPLNNWNGGITFHAYDKELLYIGLYPNLEKLAVRNAVFSRGSLVPVQEYRLVDATYPAPDEEGYREYTLYFSASGFGIRSGHDTLLIYIPYDELTKTQEFAEGINSVTFGLKNAPDKGPILLQYTIGCADLEHF